MLVPNSAFGPCKSYDLLWVHIFCSEILFYLCFVQQHPVIYQPEISILNLFVWICFQHPGLWWGYTVCDIRVLFKMRSPPSSMHMGCHIQFVLLCWNLWWVNILASIGYWAWKTNLSPTKNIIYLSKSEGNSVFSEPQFFPHSLFLSYLHGDCGDNARDVSSGELLLLTFLSQAPGML